ncbi:MAG TPA: hypothetical protein DD438_12070, partial [Verrucomicrobiales bacterium]|nr:hypothetical protein [Verrucomicrobiales bacterium]
MRRGADQNPAIAMQATRLPVSSDKRVNYGPISQNEYREDNPVLLIWDKADSVDNFCGFFGAR